MSGYNYGPPPPPPATNSSYGSSQSYGRGGGRGGGRGRGNHSSSGRGGSQPSYSAYAQQYQGQPQYPAASYPTPGGYPQGQWPGHGQPAAAHQHAPVPLSPANYHPNYATAQQYPPAQYPQQPAYGQQSYPHHYQAPPPPGQTQWAGRGQSNHPRGAHSSHAQPPPSGGYPQQYPSGHYAPPAYPYPGPPAPPSLPRHDSHHAMRGGRGRGNNRDRDRGGRGGRGRGGHHGDRNHAQKQNHNHNNSNGTKNADNNTSANQKTTSPSAPKKKKRKTNTLGLTPAADSESEDDEGEEKALTDLIGTEALKISDVAAFIAERRKNFPTKARMEAKKAAEEAQKTDDTSLLEKQADKLRRQLAKVESSIKRKREHGDDGEEEDEASSSDEAPEAMSTRKTADAAPKKTDMKKHCKYYSTGGTCGKKGKCRFVHDPEVREAAMKEREANNGRLTIQQRLILNDKEQEDLTVLRSIQYLRERGIMGIAAKTDEVSVEEKKQDKTSDTPPKTSSLLPAPSASLPPLPPKPAASKPQMSEPEPPAEPEASANSETAEQPKEKESEQQPQGTSNDEDEPSKE